MKKYFPFAVRQLSFAFALFFFAAQNGQAQLVHGENIEDIAYRLASDSTLYQRLADRFSEGDSTLSMKELSTLYYGYALRPAYDPLAEDRILKAVYALGRREKYGDALNLLDNFLDKHPACLSALLEQAYTAWLVDDSLGTVDGFKKYYQLLEVPLTSGDGNSSENAFVVSSERDMELVLDKLGYNQKAQSLITKQGQHFFLVTCSTKEQPDTEKQFYFNVDLVVKGRKVRE